MNKINGRTPDEVKMGLEIVKDECTKIECLSSTCPYYKDCAPRTSMMREVPAQLVRDNIKYIQQLERERDTAVKDLEAASEQQPYCGTCINANIDANEEPCVSCMAGYLANLWQWRGVQEVE